MEPYPVIHLDGSPYQSAVSAKYTGDTVDIIGTDGSLIASMSPMSAVRLANQLRQASLDALSDLSQRVGAG
jgi:hypothetical protein